MSQCVKPLSLLQLATVKIYLNFKSSANVKVFLSVHEIASFSSDRNSKLIMETQRCGKTKHALCDGDHWDQLNCPKHLTSTKTQCEISFQTIGSYNYATLSELNLCDG